MKITKEASADGRLFIVRSDCHGGTFATILTLTQAARQDFPALTDGDIHIVQYAGDDYPGTFGIECRVPEGTLIPATYPVRQHSHHPDWVVEV